MLIVSLGSCRQVIMPYHNSTDTVAPRKGVPVRPARSHPKSMLAANPACGRSRCESLNKSGRWPQTLPGNKDENTALGWWGLRISVGEKPLLADTCPKAVLSRCPYTHSYYVYDLDMIVKNWCILAQRHVEAPLGDSPSEYDKARNPPEQVLPTQCHGRMCLHACWAFIAALSSLWVIFFTFNLPFIVITGSLTHEVHFCSHCRRMRRVLQ